MNEVDIIYNNINCLFSYLSKNVSIVNPYFSPRGIKMNISKELLVKSASVLLLMSLSACGGMSTRDKSTAIGAGVGAVGGAVLTGGSAVGTVGGAAVGGVIGNQIGKDKE
jgi:osmotically inducible lipoprotein OsmB